MAEFKLDRIRFRYRGDWSSATNYVKDDVIRYGAKVYVCIEVHQADANFYNDLNNSTPRWVQMMDGQSWTGEWQAATFYRIGDLVKLGGVIYKCIEGHTSNTSANDGILGDELKWVYFARGENWTSVWTPETLYNVDDTVIYGGTVYKCLTSHQSQNADAGLEFDAEKWEFYSQSDNFRGEWQPNTHYYIDDIARYGGILYRAIGSHISTPNIVYTNPTNTYNQDNVNNPTGGTNATFEVYRDGGNYYGKILTAGSGYIQAETFTVLGSNLNGADSTNDCTITITTVDGTGAITAISVAGTADATVTFGLETDAARWETALEGVEYKTNFAQYTHYKVNEIVKWSPGLWKVTTSHFAFNQNLDETKFSLFVPGLEFETQWVDTQYYQKGDIVLYGGYSYVALQSNVASKPAVTDSTGNWELIFPGYNYRGEWVGTVENNGVNEPVPYKTGDVVLAGGNLYIAVRDNEDTGPDTESVYDPGSDDPFPWQLLVTGKRWRGPWIETTSAGANEYFPGDVVTVAGTLWACIDKHMANSSDAKPPLDLESENVGPYWVLLAQGAPGNVLEYPGDLKTQNDDSTRLRIGIGTPGQISKVSANGFPGWGDFELTTNVYYVAPEGADTPDNGLLPSAPFASIKYACEYIQESPGTRTPATVFIKTGFYEEQLPIKVPRDTALVGDELRSTNVRPAPGFESQNMFYVNNGSGIRNMTLQGLSGTLGDVNEYGTRRPTGGAFVSLDPGTGPTDATTWITSKSCYVQNVSTFGSGAIGLKVDGDLHNGGNKSVVANDFTQIIDNGIGFWVNGDGKSELVSVFTYYNHIGYLATNGGKVRATNGNNSYGDFGSVAEGVAATETPITCKIDNYTGEAIVNDVYNDENEIYAFAYTHGGENYTTANITIEGSGEGAAASIKYENTRDGAIKEIRIKGPDDSSPAGGAQYTQIDGTARSGTSTQIELAAQLGRPASELIGQRIYLREGRGRGQYAYIDTFNEVTKVATVKREWDDLPGWQHLLGGFPIEELLDASTKYVIEPRITFSNPPYAKTLSSVGSSGSFLVGEYGRVGSTNVTVVVGNGTARRTSNGTSWTTHGAPAGNYVDTARSDNWFFAVSSDGKVIRSQDGATWNDISNSVGTDVFRGVAAYGTNVIVASETGVVYYSSDDGANWNNSQVEPYDGSTPVFTQAAGGNGMFLLANTEGATWESADDGITWRQSTNIGGNKYRVTDLIYGGGKFVASVQDSPLDDSTSPNKFYVTTATKASIQDSALTRWQESATPPHAGPYYVSYSQGVYVAITSSGELAYSQDAMVWLELDTPLGGTFQGICAGRSSGAFFVPIEIGNQSNLNVISYGARPLVRIITNAGKLSRLQIFEPGSGYVSAPTVTVTDNKNTIDAVLEPRMASGVLTQPTFTNRGTGFLNVSATIDGDGFKDEYQTGKVIQIKELSREPGPGDLLFIDGIDDQVYRVTQITNLTGSEPNLTATFRISPSLRAQESPDHETVFTIRQLYSQVRLTGHDFLDIGTGGVTTTNYPELYTNKGFTEGYEAQPNREVKEGGGGRVFYTSTDQDGNFRVGELFEVEQATGIVTLNADLFNLAGLSELSLGGVVLGGTEVVIREFSTDPTMAANSDNIVPTQKAIVSYINSRVSGGGSNLNVSRVRAGSVRIETNQIFNEADPVNGTITFPVTVFMNKGISGSLLALSYFTGGTASVNLDEGDAVSTIDSSNGYGN